MVGGVKDASAITTQVVNAPQKESEDAGAGKPKFGEIWNQIQTKYGAKPEKPREIKKQLDKDDFLRIMISQMKNQDPTQPFKAEQFATELAQFSTVEQLHNMNSSLNKMQNQNQPLERLAMTNLIGKTVTVDRERFPHAEGSAESLSFALPSDAKNVQVAIISESGETVLEKDLGELKKGDNSFSWDGNKANRMPAKGGNYMFRIAAKDAREQSIPMNAQSQGRVIGVSFEGTEPVFLVGDASHQDKVTLKNIVKIDSDPSGLPAAANATAAAAPTATPGTSDEAPAAEGAAKSNFFTFKKGEGSSNLDSGQMSPEVSQALHRFQEQQKMNQRAEARAAANTAYSPATSSERGFPNGLHDGESLSPSQGPEQPNPNNKVKGGEKR